MTRDAKIWAAIEAAATDLLAPIPKPDMLDDGYDWMRRLRGSGWEPVSSARDGRPLGSWPYQIVAHHDDHERGLYGLAVYTEGDLHVEGHWDKTARDQESDEYAQEPS